MNLPVNEFCGCGQRLNMHQPRYCFAVDSDRHCADCGIPFDQDILKFVIARGAVQALLEIFVCQFHYEMRLWREERVRG